jgi:hypothetical protein
MVESMGEPTDKPIIVNGFKYSKNGTRITLAGSIII